MESSSQELELYTIPSHSSWFSWINIHEVERFSLREFFDGSSITRTPRIYKECRDFIISKFREDPSRKLTFTEVRKSLVGDVSVLHKVFTFLEKWGLINFTVNEGDERNKFGEGVNTAPFEEEESWRGKVKVEEGAPYGVRVVAAPNSMKPAVPPPLPPSVVANGGGFVGEVGENGFKWPPLASYSDVYGDLMQQEKKKCENCEETCDSAHYEYVKEEGFFLCEKCFKSGNYDKNKSADDFKLIDSVNQGAVWTEAETLLLLESISRHGDDWDLVAKDVKTKSRLDCISKLIQLPFGDLMLGGGNRKKRYLDIVDYSKQEELAANGSRDSVTAEDPSLEIKDNDPENGDTENEGPPPKRLCKEPTSDEGPALKKLLKEPNSYDSSTLMKQVVRITTMVGPHVTASAADAAVTALCFENQCSREIFDDDVDDDYTDPKASDNGSSDEKRASGNDISVEDEKSNRSEIQESALATKSIIPLNLRSRAAAATALGAAAANAKLLADQEEREIEHLVAILLEAQLKKLCRKVKYFEDLELIMEEHAQIEELEESLVEERLNVLKNICGAGITKSKENTSVKYQSDTPQ